MSLTRSESKSDQLLASIISKTKESKLTSKQFDNSKRTQYTQFCNQNQNDPDSLQHVLSPGPNSVKQKTLYSYPRHYDLGHCSTLPFSSPEKYIETDSVEICTEYKNKHQYDSVPSQNLRSAEKYTEHDSAERKKSYPKKVDLVYCEPCHTDQTVIQAHGFCINCTEYLCKSCFNSHKKSKAFKNHILQGYNEMPTDAELITVTVEDHCQKHDGKPLEYFCNSCDELACTVCMFKQHRSCENVDYIPEIAESLEESDEYKQLTEDIQCLDKKFTAEGKTLEASLKTSEESRDQALAKIKKEADEVKKVLDRLTTKMNHEVQKRFTTEKEKLDRLKEKNKELSEQLKTAHNRIKYSKNARQMNKLFISIKKERKAVDDLEKEQHKLRKDINIKSYTFKASKPVENLKILSEIGDLHEVSQTHDIGDLHEVSQTYDKGSDSLEIPVSDAQEIRYHQREECVDNLKINTKRVVDFDVSMRVESLPVQNESHSGCYGITGRSECRPERITIKKNNKTKRNKKNEERQ